MQLDSSVFAALGALGPLTRDAFSRNLAGRAKDDTDRIIYETDTGKLFYDADGTGAGTAVHFADVSAGLSLTYADFLVV